MGLGRWELLRALGAVAADPAAAADLGLPSAGTTGHGEVFTRETCDSGETHGARDGLEGVRGGQETESVRLPLPGTGVV